MRASCAKHPFDSAVATCRTCDRPFCENCLVWSEGEKKPPFCIPCALRAAGVRTTKASVKAHKHH